MAFKKDSTKTFKVKAQMDSLKSESGFAVVERIMDEIPWHYEDDVYEFEITINKINKVEQIIDEEDENSETFTGVEIDGEK